MNVNVPNTLSLRRIYRTLGLPLLLAVLVPLTGCNKMLAKYYVGQAQKRVDEARKNEAERFQPDLLTGTTAKIGTAENQINGNDTANAKITAKAASDQSKELLDKTKSTRATTLRDDAYKWLDIAKKNQGQTENAQLYDKVNQENDKGKQYLDKQDYDNAIKTFANIVSEVDYMLKNLERDAKQGLEDAKGMLVQLKDAGAPEFAPEYVQKLQTEIQSISDSISKETNYRAALDKRNEARQTLELGIRDTNKAKSQKMLSEIENLLDEATTLGADIYASQNFRVVTKDYSTLLSQFYDAQYPSVLTNAPVLKPKVQDLIIETKRAAADAGIQSVQKAINSLADMKARTYLPGRVEQLEARLKEAKDLFAAATAVTGTSTTVNASKYTDSKQISDAAMDSNQRILEEFDSLAQIENNKANERVTTAEGVLTRMDAIFQTKIEGNWTGEEKALEDSKLGLEAELKGKLAGASTNVGVASLKRTEKTYNQAIEISKQAQADAEYVTLQTYRVVAHNAVLEIANQISRSERNGGREYASAELSKTQTMLEDTKGLLQAGTYREAVRKAADTKAQLEITKQEMTRVALARMADANAAINSAEASRGKQYEPDTLLQAGVALENAKAALEAEGQKAAIEQADRAKQIANEAQRRSQQKWVEEDLARADLLIDRAHQAGASRYAPEQLQKAEALRGNLKKLYDTQAYKEAIGLSEETVNAAGDALYAKVNEADTAIATAKRFEGWEYEGSKMAQAIVTAKNAREELEAGDYRNAELNSAQAIVSAQNLTVSAKRKSFDARMTKLQGLLEVAERKGPGSYQSKDLSKILAEMNSLRQEFNPKTYDDYNKPLDLLEAQLGGLMELTPDVLKDVVAQMNDSVSKLKARGADKVMPDQIETISKKINYAQLDFKDQKFRPSFMNAKDAQKLIDDVTRKMDERDFDVALNAELANFTEELAKFQDVLNMGAEVMGQLATGIAGRTHAVAILHSTNPDELRQRIVEIGARVQRLTPPPTRHDVQAETLDMLVTAREGAEEFGKLAILDEYTPAAARALITKAYTKMYRARTMEQKIEGVLGNPASIYQKSAVERVVSSNEVK